MQISKRAQLLQFRTSISCASLALLFFSTLRVADAETVYGVTENQFLISWDSAAPGTLITGSVIMGLQQNERILGIDFRPSTGELFGLGSMSQLYTLNPNTAAATAVGTGFGPINGSAFAFDFNPTLDRIRVVSDTNNNYVLNPNDGTLSTATNVSYNAADVHMGADPNITHAAYTNNFDGATTTQLYVIDAGFDTLVKQANSAGTLDTVAALGIDLTVRGGFDISESSGIAYLSAEEEGNSQSTFYRVDLDTGITTFLGQIGGGSIITATAVSPAPEPTTATLTILSGVTLAAFARRRRR